MAQRRMFSKTVIETDIFLDMSQTSQNLYFHLGMRADDDGFVSPKMVMRILGSTDDDLILLKVKGFIIPFESGVIVIRHWKQNNYIQTDRYTPTIFKEEYKLACNDNVYKMDTQVRLGKVSQDKKKEKEKTSFSPPSLNDVKTYCNERQNNVDPQRFIDFYESKGWMVGKNKMKSWQAAVRTWEGRDNGGRPNEEIEIPNYAKSYIK